jgi:ABC-type antimicrobial peptide transport system permease subunit
MSATLTSVVFGVTPTNPAIYAGVALLLLTAAIAGALVPAVRASRLDPLAILRAE